MIKEAAFIHDSSQWDTLQRKPRLFQKSKIGGIDVAKINLGNKLGEFHDFKEKSNYFRIELINRV